MEHFFLSFLEKHTLQILRKHFILILDLGSPPIPVDCWRQHCKFLAWTLTGHSARSSITQIVLLTRLDMTSILVVLHVALKSSSLCWNWKSIAVSPNRHRHRHLSIRLGQSWDFQTAKSAVSGFKYGGRLKLDPQVSFILWTPMDRNLKKKQVLALDTISRTVPIFWRFQKKPTNLDFRVGKKGHHPWSPAPTTTAES